MLATLDNFIKVVLFNERIFVTGTAGFEANHFVPKHAECGASDAGRDLLDKAAIFLPIPEAKGDSQAVEDRLSNILSPISLAQTPLFIIQCALPKQQHVIRHEMVYLDTYFIEYAIDQFGAERFKPVFPGEHLYLGLRSQRVSVPQATQTMADVAGRRVRAIIREKMDKLNAFVSQGAPMLPTLPPMFVSRILHDSSNGSEFISVLLEIRNSPAMKRFRTWMIQCWELSHSTDLAQRTKAAEALQKLDTFSPDIGVSATQFGISLINVIKAVVTYDPVGIIDEIASPLVKYLGGIPLSGLRQFGSNNSDPQKLGTFLQDNFGDQFNRNEMDFISTLLTLPDDLAQWRKEETEFTVEGGRLDWSAPPLARPSFVRTVSPAHVTNAKKDFDELLKQAVPVTPELLKQWDAEKKKPN